MSYPWDILVGILCLFYIGGFSILLVLGTIFEYPNGKSLKEMLSEQPQ